MKIRSVVLKSLYAYRRTCRQADMAEFIDAVLQLCLGMRLQTVEARDAEPCVWVQIKHNLPTDSV